MNDASKLFAGGIQWTIEATRSEGSAWSNRNRRGYKEDISGEKDKQKKDKGMD